MSDNLPPLPTWFSSASQDLQNDVQNYAREALKLQAQEIKDHERAYELLFMENARLRDKGRYSEKKMNQANRLDDAFLISSLQKRFGVPVNWDTLLWKFTDPDTLTMKLTRVVKKSMKEQP